MIRKTGLGLETYPSGFWEFGYMTTLTSGLLRNIAKANEPKLPSV